MSKPTTKDLVLARLRQGPCSDTDLMNHLKPIPQPLVVSAVYKLRTEGRVIASMAGTALRLA